MGTTSTMLEKMHKEILTGSGYTDAEIQDAKNKADENLGQLRSELSSFMDDFLHRGSDGTNSYYDGKSLNHDALVSRVVTVVDDAARKQVVDAYNESHDVKVQSVDEITAENFMMDGNTLMALVQGYASSGIASYDSYYQQALSKSDYSRTDAMLVALVKGSRGVVDQLPTKVDESLVEMGGMNTYGIIVGVVAFGIATLLIPMVYTILLSNNLVAQKVESGSLAFTLSTPTTRNSFIFTEATYLLYSELVMGLALLLAAVFSQLVGVAAGGSDLTESLSLHDIGFYALGNFMVTVGISGICFLASCHFNKTNLAIGAGGGLTIFFFICSILGLFGTKAIPATVRIDAMGFFNYLTIDSLFDPIAVMEGNAFQYWFKLLWLLVIAGVTYTLGAVDFCHKDLPL
jgi:ABC-2 type transport system permease protein